MNVDPPEPLVAAEVDLRDYPYTPIYRARLFGSEFNAMTSDAAWRAGVTLWLKSWEQVPAGSLPADDLTLCRLAELGRDLRAWRKIAVDAMRHWILSTDGRFYHPVIAEIVNEAWNQKLARRERTRGAREARLLQLQLQRLSLPREGKGREGEAEEEPTLFGIEDISTPCARANGSDPAELELLENEDSGSFGSLRSPARSRSPLAEQKKMLLVQKLMRFAHSTMNERKRQEAINGLTGLDANHSAQWWLDKLDLEMRAKRWDDTR